MDSIEGAGPDRETDGVRRAHGLTPAADQRLIYGIETAEAESVCVHQVNRHGIFVVVPRRLAQEWTGTDRAGVSGEIDLSGGRRVVALVEKEFRRMDGCTNDSGFYPNPLEKSR